MARITYTALRDFEETIKVISNAISVVAADDSFNAAAGLSGFLDNEWVYVSGFVNAANNGWFQLNGNSTATKISQDTSTSLVDEGAGPIVTIQGYKRGLNQAYNLEFGVERADRAPETVRNRHVALGGARETILHRRDVFLDIRTGVIEEVNIKQWREFMASVEGGELFTFDRYGTVASPVEPKTASMESDSYDEQRVGNLMAYNLNFRLLLS